MPRLDVEPGSPGWFSAHLGRITASRAAACLRHNKYQGPLGAFREIMGVTTRGDNEHVKFGLQNEGLAREAFYQMGKREGWLKELYPESFWVHPVYPWLGATPDALVNDDGVADFKCPTIHFPETLPEHHEIQLRVQMACTDRQFAHYFAWREVGSYYHCRIERCRTTEDSLIADLAVFYETFIATNTEPPRRAKKEKP